jgi:hypothetical protein
MGKAPQMERLHDSLDALGAANHHQLHRLTSFNRRISGLWHGSSSEESGVAKMKTRRLS